MEKLLAERREVRRLLQLWTSTRARADVELAEKLEAHLYSLVIGPLGLTKYEEPQKWGFASLLAAVLLGFDKIELFDNPARVFDNLCARTGVSANGWKASITTRILEVVGPLDSTLDRVITGQQKEVISAHS